MSEAESLRMRMRALRKGHTNSTTIGTTKGTGLEICTFSRGAERCCDMQHSHDGVNSHGNLHGPSSKAMETGQRAVTEDERKTQSGKNLLGGGVAMKISRNLAAIGAMVLLPMQGLMAQLQNTTDFMEIACAPTSSLSTLMEEKGYNIKRIHFKAGFDLESPKGTRMLNMEMKQHPPRFVWVSLPCTRLSPLVNLTERTPEEWARFEQRQARDLKRADEVAEGMVANLENDPSRDFAWEWPTGARKGWTSKAICRLVRACEKLGKKVYWCRFHGCAYGLEYKGLPIQKSWTVLTTNRHLWLSLQKKCPGHPEHIQCRGVAAQASAYYPRRMVEAVVKAIVNGWNQPEDAFYVSLSRVRRGGASSRSPSPYGGLWLG